MNAQLQFHRPPATPPQLGAPLPDIAAQDAHPVLIVPGLGSSGPRHWQSAWQRRRPGYTRVEQDDWEARDVDAWARRIVETALPLQRPVVLVAHSFGCLAAVRAAEFQSGLIAGALLVAPADPYKFRLEHRLPRSVLAYPTTMVLSQDDPWMPAPVAREWAWRWGSAVVDLGRAGHINVDAGYTDWPEGLGLLESLCRRIDEGARGLI